jgi:hypothetical protein
MPDPEDLGCGRAGRESCVSSFREDNFTIFTSSYDIEIIEVNDGPTDRPTVCLSVLPLTLTVKRLRLAAGRWQY